LAEDQTTQGDTTEEEPKATADTSQGDGLEREDSGTTPGDASREEPGQPADASEGDTLSQEDLEALIKGTETAAEETTAPAESDAVRLPQLTPGPTGEGVGNIEMLNDVRVNVKIELGRARMRVEDIVHLSKGSLVELDKLAGDPVDVLVNDQLVAKGEITIINDNFCVRVLRIVTPKERLERM